LRTLSIRFRLTVWYFCFFALAGFLLSVASWLLLEQSLDTLTLHELHERIDDLESLLAAQAPDANLDALRAELMREYRSRDEGKWLQLLDGQGNWLYYSSRSRVADGIAPLSQAPATVVPFQEATGHHLRAYSRELQAHGHSYRVSMAISADSSALILDQFRRDLLFLVPMVLLAAAVVGHLLSRKALAPVAAIISEVRRINERNLSTRLLVVPTQDEISLLSETLNQMLERIDAAFRSVRSLTANTSHELRTPLSLIRTRVEVALCFPRTADHYRSVLEEVQAETLRMTSLIESLLALARYDAGATQPELEPVEVTSLMARTAREWTPTAERLSLDLQMIPAHKPAWVLGHAESLNRAIRALVENACRYTPSGGWIRLHAQDTERGTVTLSVEDSGIGIAEHDLHRIFERFYRAQQPQHEEQAGSGLGLSLAKWIVDQHKGSISVESTPGAGSRFHISLPAYIAAEVDKGGVRDPQALPG